MVGGLCQTSAGAGTSDIQKRRRSPEDVSRAGAKRQRPSNVGSPEDSACSVRLQDEGDQLDGDLRVIEE